MMKVGELLSFGRERLQSAKIDEAQTECEHMLMHLLGVNRAELFLFASAQSVIGKTDRVALTEEQEQRFFDWIREREKRIPLAYLLGDVFFHSLKLKVRSGCLIPRPETEKLVEEANLVLRSDSIQCPRVLDIGAGSGAIALAILSGFPDGQATLVDFSKEALEIARENAAALGFLNRVEFIFSDLFSNLSRDLKFDLIVSNPPYLTKVDLRDLQPEVGFEPLMALDGGEDGLSFYRRIIPEAKFFLKPQGWLGFEVGAGQSVAVCEELERHGYEDLRVFRDHQDIERVVLCRLGSGLCPAAGT